MLKKWITARRIRKEQRLERDIWALTFAMAFETTTTPEVRALLQRKKDELAKVRRKIYTETTRRGKD